MDLLLIVWLIVGTLLAMVAHNMGSRTTIQIAIIFLWPVVLLVLAFFGGREEWRQ